MQQDERGARYRGYAQPAAAGFLTPKPTAAVTWHRRHTARLFVLADGKAVSACSLLGAGAGDHCRAHASLVVAKIGSAKHYSHHHRYDGPRRGDRPRRHSGTGPG